MASPIIGTEDSVDLFYTSFHPFYFKIGTSMRVIEKTILTACILLSAFALRAQAPPNDECVNAITLTPGAPGASCVPTPGTLVGATESVGTTCVFTSNFDNEDVWYKFTATGPNHVVAVTATSAWEGFVPAPILEVRSGPCNGTTIACAYSLNFEPCAVTVTGLTVGATYYIRIYNYFQFVGAFDVCVMTPVGPLPVNDEPANATVLTPGALGAACTPTAGTNVNATQTDNDNCGFTFTLLGDVWYKFTATAVYHVVTVAGSSPFDAKVEAYDPTFAFDIALDCQNQTGPGGTEVMPLNNLTIGNTYFVRVFGVDGGSGTFTVCVTRPTATPPLCLTNPTSPANNAAVSYGSPVVLSWPAAPGATSYEVYLGTSSTPPLVATVTTTTYTTAVLPFGLYYWRVVPINSVGPAGACTVWEFSVVPGNDECANAVALTPGAPGASCVPTPGTLVGATESVGTECTFTSNFDNEDVWYKFTATGPNHVVAVTATSAWEGFVPAPILEVRSGPCNGTTIACAYSLNFEPCAVTVTGLTVGATYYIRIYNYFQFVGDFEVCVMTPGGPLPVNDEPANATVLTPGAACTPTAGTNVNATQTDNDNCGFTFSLLGDVWYKFTATAANHVVTVAGSSPFDAKVEAYDPTFAFDIALDCQNQTGPGGTEVMTLNGLTVGNTYFVRVFGVDGGTGTFTVCVTTPAPPLCVATPTAPTVGAQVCPGGTVTLSWPAATNATSYQVYFGTSATPPLVTTVTGTTYTTATLPAGAYFWQVRPVNNLGTASGCAVWNFTVTDAQAPTITCPANITQPNTAGLCGRVVTYATPTATDNCTATPTVTQLSGLASGASFPVGTIANVWRATDAAGNSSSCTVTVTITDTQAPTITCPANQTVNAAAGQCTAVATYTTPTGSDNCSPVTVAHVSGGLSGTTFPAGPTTVIWRATDPSSNSTTCSFTVTVNVDIVPTISCPANIVQPNTAGTCGRVVSFTSPTASVCGQSSPVTQTAGLASGSTFPVGVSTLIYQASSGVNTATCSFTITINDTQAPAITCPANINQANAPGLCSATVTYTAPTGTDNCSAMTTQIGGLASGATYPVGTTTNTFRATDPAGNSTTCAFTVTVTDAEAPAIACPANSTQPNTAGQCAANVNFAGAGASDNCTASPTITQIAGPAWGSSFPVGTTSVSFRAVDAAGNSATCTFTVTVNDTQAPTITCPANQTVTPPVGQCTAVVTYSAPQGSDNCSPVTVQHVSGGLSGTTFQAGATTIIWRATDPAANSTTCSFTITVNANTVPSITCPANIVQPNTAGVCGGIVTFSAPTAPIVCGQPAPVTQTGGPAPGSTFPVGTSTVSYVSTAPGGATGTCAFTVTINDTQAPAITCPAGIVANNTPNQCGANVTYTAPVGTDNCSATTTQTGGLASGAFYPVGTTTNTFRAIDPAGNSTTCAFTVTINDTQAPAITCPANITQPNTTGQCGRVVTYTAPVGTDNCSATTAQTGGLASGAFYPVGTTTNTFRAIDPAGNSTTCAFTINITDTQAPAITCPANVTQPNTTGQCGRVVTYTAPVGTDNCSATTVQIGGLASGAFFPVGTTTNTFRATDPAGNSTTCAFTVTINDTQAPTITCPANIIVTNAPNLCGRVVAYTTPVGTDNCSATTTQTMGLASGAFFPVGLTTNTFRATDPAGNTAQCSFTVRVNDVQPPTIACPAAKTVLTTGYTCQATGVTLGLPTVADNCGINAPATNNAPAAYPVGTTSVVWTIKDPSNNTASCVQTVTVLDQQLPVIQCPTGPVTATADPATCTATVDYAVTAYDNCSAVTLAYNHPPLSEFDLNNTLVTATVTDGSGNTNSCSFYVFVDRAEEVCNDVDDDCDGLTDEADDWNFLVRRLASDGAAGEQYGTAVDLDGDYAVAGAEEKTPTGQTLGAAYVLRRDGNGLWNEVLKLSPATLEVGDAFGTAVALHGSWLAVGAPGDDDAADNAGAIYLYQQDGGNPDLWIQSMKIVPANLQVGDGLGAGLSLRGDYLLAGALGDDEADADAGAVYVFGRNQGGANNWGLVKKLTAPFGAANDQFGARLDYDGSHAVISAAGDDQYGDNAGAAYVFGRNTGGPNNFGLVKKLTAGDGQGGDNFGASVAIAGDFALVGADQQDDKGANAGKVYAFYRNQWSVPNSWGQMQGILDFQGQAGDNFGAAVAMELDYAAIGAPGADFLNNLQNAGKVVLYQRQQNGYVPVETITAIPQQGQARFGTELALHDRTVLAGVPFDDAAFQPDRGSVVFFAGVCAGTDSRMPAPEGAATGDPATQVAVTAFPVPFSDVLNVIVQGGGQVRISVLNQLGQEIAVLYDGALTGEALQVQWQAGKVPAGLYFVRAVVDGAVETKPVVLAR